MIGQCIGRRRVQQATGNDHLNSFPVTRLLVRFNSSIKLQQRLYSNITTNCRFSTSILNTEKRPVIRLINTKVCRSQIDFRSNMCEVNYNLTVIYILFVGVRTHGLLLIKLVIPLVEG